MAANRHHPARGGEEPSHALQQAGANAAVIAEHLPALATANAQAEIAQACLPLGMAQADPVQVHQDGGLAELAMTPMGAGGEAGRGNHGPTLGEAISPVGTGSALVQHPAFTAISYPFQGRVAGGPGAKDLGECDRRFVD